MQAVDNQELFLLAEGDVLLRPFEGRREPVIERVRRVENFREHEIQQTPKLLQIVLDRRSRQEQPVSRLIDSPENFRQLRVLVLQPVPLVDDDVLPLELGEELLVAHDHVIVGEKHVEGLCRHSVIPQLLPLLRLAVVEDDVVVWQPPPKLNTPVAQHGFGAQDEVGSIVALLFHEVSKQRDGLDGLTEAHLVREDPIQPVDVQGNHPLQARQLVLSELAALEHHGLLVHWLLL
mmetsp:Transcript_7352/g.21307  ORF Transcript_7352/g.21307 Transcript_7352/m.21307 type:complete len:234 (+) Transcript_7352:462-1163(+)